MEASIARLLPYLHASTYGRRIALDLNLKFPTYGDSIFGQVPYLESVAIWNPEADKLAMFAVNRNLDQGVALIGHLRDFEDYWIMSHTILEHENLKAFNSFDHPDEV